MPLLSTIPSPRIVLHDVFLLLRRAVSLIERPMFVSPATGRIQAEAVQSGTWTVGTVTTVTGVTNLGGADARYSVHDWVMRNTWNNCIRSRIV